MIFIHTLAQAVAAAQPEAIAAVQTQGVISYQPEQLQEGQPNNALDMLNRVPGFNVDVGDNVRGFEGAAGNVLIDGARPASKSDNLEQILIRIPVSQVARIDIIRGGAPGIDMQGQSVLANVVRKDGGGFRGVLAVSGTQVYDGRTGAALRTEGSGKIGQTGWELGFVGGRGFDDGAGDGPRVRLDPNGTVLIRSEVDSEGEGDNGTFTGALERPFAGGEARVNGRYYFDHFEYDENNRRSFPAPGLELSWDDYDETSYELGGRWARPLGARTRLELVALNSGEHQEIVSAYSFGATSEQFSLDRTYGESIGRGVLRFTQSPQISWEVGGEGAFNWLESETAYVQNGAPVALPAANVRVEELRGEVFAKTTWKPSADWTFEGGLRGEGSAISSEGDVSLEKTLYFIKPRVTAAWAATPATQIRFRLEREVGQLDFDDFVADSSLNTGMVTAGNPDLEPEQAWVAEAAVERRFWEKGAVVLTLRHFAIEGVIDRAPIFDPSGSVFDAPANLGDGIKQELALDITLPLDRLGVPRGQLKTNGVWRRSEVDDPTTGESREISGLRHLEWEAHFTQDVPAWNATWGVDAYSAWRETYYRYDQIQTRKLKTFVVPFYDWKPRPDLSIRFEVRNATSRGFRNTRQVFTGPRDANPLQFIDDRDVQFGPMYYVRIRKALG